MRGPLVLLGAVLVVLACAAPAAALDDAELRRSLSRHLRASSGLTSAYAVDLRTGRVLYAVRANVDRIPASVTKLYTTSAALLRLGPATRLMTRASSDVAISPQGVVAGDVRLVGGGDPTLGRGRLVALARAVRRAGVRRIDGRVRGDSSWFDRLFPRTGRRIDIDVGGLLSALVLNRGLTTLGRWQRDPADYAADKFAAALRDAGVKVTGRRARRGGPPAQTALAGIASPTIAHLARRTNVPSDNYLAEMLLKNVGARNGRPGSTAAGAAAARAELARLGVRPRIADGSGLSRFNRTSPREVVRLFARLAQDPAGPALRASLAVAGRSGTIRRRMRGTRASGRCRAKTGTLRNVSALAGICVARNGHDVAFAWMMNRANVDGARRAQDRMTAALANYEG